MILTRWWRQLRARVKYRHYERDLPLELAFHADQARRARESAGIPREAARRAAALAMGNTTLAREDARAVWLPRLWQELAQDARYGLRGLRRSPGFSMAAVVMLTVGLGLTMGAFDVFNALFLRGWPVPDSDRVFTVSAVFPKTEGRVRDGFSYGAFKYLLTNARAAEYAASGGAFFRISDTPDGRSPGPYVPVGLLVSDNFFHALQIPMQLGTPPGSEASSAGVPSVVISDRVWRLQFGADPAIVGRTIFADGNAVAVAGVAAPGFDGLDRVVAIYTPLWAAPRMEARSSAAESVANDAACCISLAARLRPGFRESQAASEIEVLMRQYRSSVGKPEFRIEISHPTLGGALNARGGGMGSVGALVLAPILLILVLTCANVGNLHLARTLRRQHEIATRLSLGASRWRLVRQLLTEGLMLAGLAGAAAFGAALAVPTILRLTEADAVPATFAPDWRVAAVTVALAVLVCLSVSLAPALRTTQVVWRGSAALASNRTRGLRSVLLAVQIAIATVLVLTTSLLTRGVYHAMSGPADFALHDTTAAVLELPAGTPIEQRVRLGRVVSAAVTNSQLPLGLVTDPPVASRSGISTEVNSPASLTAFSTQLFPMSAPAAKVLDLRLVTGRWASDLPDAKEAVVNETLARRVWGRTEVAGERLALRFNRTTYTVVGVVADSHLLSLRAIPAVMHVPPLDNLPVVLFRNSAETQAAVRQLLAGVDPAIRPAFVPLSESVKATLVGEQVVAATAGGVSLVALLLAMIGVYGVLSYSVEERRREIGIRLALGAERRDVGMALLLSARAAIIGGLAAGVVLSAVGGMWLRGFLFGLSPLDPLSYLVAAAILGCVAILAMLVPVRRAARVDPAVILRAV